MGRKPVHPLEVFTRNTFGEPFASVILHGLGGEGVGDKGVGDICPTFERIDGEGRAVRTTLSVTTHLPGGWGYRPLILAAVFKLLLKRLGPKDRLEFRLEEVLNELIWPNTPACRREVEDALEFYSGCSYLRRDVDADGQVIQASYYLILWREAVREFRPQSDLFRDEGNTVSVEAGLAAALRHGAVVFAEISFGNLASALREEAVRAPIASRRRSGRKSGKVVESAARDFRPPEARPTVLLRASPVSRRRADRRPKILSRPVGQTDISVDTGAVARTVLRALHRTAARHPAAPPYVDSSLDHIAEYVFRQVDHEMRRAAYTLVRQVRRRVFEDASLQSYGLMHSKGVKSPRERGPKPMWHSPGQLVEALARAIRAVEFDGWKPKQHKVVINRRWDVNKIQTATLKLVAAYWSEEEGMSITQIDSGRMRKWLTSLGLPSFSVLRSEVRKRIQADRVNGPFFALCEGSLGPLVLIQSLMMSDEEASN